MENIVSMLTLPILMTVSNIWRGVVLSRLWLWFIVPTFGLPNLNIATAIGISLILQYLTYRTPTHIKSEEHVQRGSSTMLKNTAIYSFAYPVFALIFGWIVHQFM